jgi:hypothetical protein
MPPEQVSLRVRKSWLARALERRRDGLVCWVYEGCWIGTGEGREGRRETIPSKVGLIGPEDQRLDGVYGVVGKGCRDLTRRRQLVKPFHEREGVCVYCRLGRSIMTIRILLKRHEPPHTWYQLHDIMNQRTEQNEIE